MFEPRIPGLITVVKKYNMLDGDVRFIKVWVYQNAEGLIDLFEVRYENEHNKKAVMYYLKHDFVPEGYCKDHFREGVDEIILGRFLKSTETLPKRCRPPQ